MQLFLLKLMAWILAENSIRETENSILNCVGWRKELTIIQD